MAIYTKLIWDLKPATLIEVGTLKGGSALWLADMLSAAGLAARVVSVDQNLQSEVKDYDPARALDGGADGLAAYRIIARQAAGHLSDGGRLAVEIGHTQRHEAALVFEAEGWRLTEARQDFGGRDRVLVFERG